MKSGESIPDALAARPWLTPLGYAATQAWWEQQEDHDAPTT